MKFKSGYQRIVSIILVLALAQLACNLGAQIPNTGAQQLPTLAAQAIQLAATLVPTVAALATEMPTIAPQPTQPPNGGNPAAQPTQAVSHGTPDEAKSMLQKAVEHYKAVGRQQALTDFTGRVAPFFDRDLYVACIDSNLVQSANGGFPALVGSSVQPLSRAAWDAAAENKIDSIDYPWINPATGNEQLKTFYYEKVGTDVCSVGIYH